MLAPPTGILFWIGRKLAAAGIPGRGRFRSGRNGWIRGGGAVVGLRVHAISGDRSLSAAVPFGPIPSSRITVEFWAADHRRGLLVDALVVIVLGAASAVALWKRPVGGFLGAWFFVILAPSSSVLPIATEIMAERRMYLSLAAVMVLLVYGLQAVAPRPRTFLTVVGLLAVGFAVLTARRNRVYQSVEAFLDRRRPQGARECRSEKQPRQRAGRKRALCRSHGTIRRGAPSGPRLCRCPSQPGKCPFPAGPVPGSGGALPRGFAESPLGS